MMNVVVYRENGMENYFYKVTEVTVNEGVLHIRCGEDMAAGFSLHQALRWVTTKSKD